MSQIVVIAPGASTIQDVGRFGLQRYGVASAGAMDRTALRRANALVGSPPGAPAIELGPLPVTLEITGAPVRFTLTGAAREASIGVTKADGNQTHIIREGERLLVGNARAGMYSYLAFEGGLASEPCFGSCSLDQRAGFGSPLKEPLQAGDILEVAAATAWTCERKAARTEPAAAVNNVIRVVLGPQDDYFFPETIEQFLDTRWRVSLNSNRMCYCLEGPLLAHAKGYNIVSDATVRGAIQIAGSGQPFVLLNDRGTIGGYPKIATLATVDIDRFVQIPPNSEVRFTAVSVERAQSLLRAQASSAAPRIQDAPRIGLDEAALSAANLAGTATNALEPAVFEW